MVKKSPIRGRDLTEWEQETVMLAYAESGNMAHAARVAGVTYAAAKHYRDTHLEELHEARERVKGNIIESLALVRRLAIEELATPSRIAKASIQELVMITAVMTDKIQILSGGATAHVAHLIVNPQALSPEEREHARELRAKMLAEGGRVEEGVIDATHSLKPVLRATHVPKDD